MRAQAGVSLAVLVPAISLLALYPLLPSCSRGLASYEVLGLPLTLIILGAASTHPSCCSATGTSGEPSAWSNGLSSC